MNESLKSLIQKLETDGEQISEKRKSNLKTLAEALLSKQKGQVYQLVFVCTHNSRRSVFGQVWAHLLAEYYSIPLESYSGGTEVTAVNDKALACLKDLGFETHKNDNTQNPKIDILYGDSKPITCYSKLFDDKSNPQDNFFAIMLCEHAAENCPFIPNAQQRINLTYPDPKQFDNTALQDEKYKAVAIKIGQELMYLMRLIKQN